MDNFEASIKEPIQKNYHKFSTIEEIRLHYPRRKILIIVLSLHYFLSFLSLIFNPDIRDIWSSASFPLLKESIEYFVDYYHFSIALKENLELTKLRYIVAALGGLQIIFSLLMIMKYIGFRKGFLLKMSYLLHNQKIIWISYIFSTIIADLFINEFSCYLDISKGVYLHRNYPQSQCFGDLEQILLTVFSCISLIALITNVTCSLYFSFNRRLSINSVWLRRSMEPEIVLYILTKSLEIYLEVLGRAYLYSYSILMSTGLFYVTYLMFNPYYITSYSMRKETYFGVVSSFWFSVGLLYYTFNPDGISTEDNLIVFFSTWLILMVAVYLRREDVEYRLLHTNLADSKCPNPHLIYLESLTLIFLGSHKYDRNRELLHGYIAYHQRICIDHECYISPKVLFSSGKILADDSTYFSNVNFNFLEFISSEYIKSIRIWPESFELKLSYIYFLMDIMQAKGIALDVLYSALPMSRSIRHQFLLFDLKSIMNSISAGVDSNQRGVQQGLSDEKEKRFSITLSKLKNELSRYMEKTTFNFTELWKHINSENTEVKKLISTLSRIHINLEKVEAVFKQQKHILMMSPPLLKKYGIFQMFVLNEVDKGSKIVEHANKLLDRHIKEDFNIKNIKLGYDLGNSSDPTAILLVSVDNLKIIASNLAFAAKVGLKRDELKNCNLLSIIPKVFRAEYLSILTTVESNINELIADKPFKLMLLKKGDFLKEFNCYYKLIKSQGNKTYLIIKLEEEYYEMISTKVLLDSHGRIIGLDERFFNLLALESDEHYPKPGTNISSNRIDLRLINKVIFEMNQKKTTETMVGTIENIPALYESITYEIKRLELKGEKHSVFQVRIREFLGEKCQTARTNLTEFMQKIKPENRAIGEEEFCFEIIPPSFDALGYYRKSKTIVNIDIKKGYNLRTTLLSRKTETETVNMKKTLSEKVSKSIVNYAEGIQTKRLLKGGKIGDAYQYGESDEDESENLNARNSIRQSSVKESGQSKITSRGKKALLKNTMKLNSKPTGNLENIAANDRSQEELRRLISQVNRNGVSRMIIILALLSFSMASIFFIVQGNLLKDSKDKIAVYSQINRAYCNIYSILCKVHSPLVDMLLFNQGDPVNDLEKVNYESIMKERLMKSLESLISENRRFEQLMDKSGDVIFSKNTTENKINYCYFYPNTRLNTTLEDCLNKLQASIVNVYNLQMDEMNMHNPDVYMVMMNAVNKLQIYLIKAYYAWPVYVDGVLSNNYLLSTFKYLNYSLYIYTIITVFVVLCLFMNMVNKHEDVLELFYGFSGDDCRILDDRCEYFLNYVQFAVEENADDVGFDDLQFIKQTHKKAENTEEIVLPSRGNRKGQLFKHYLPRLIVLTITAILHQLFIFGSFEILSKMITDKEPLINFASTINAADLVFLSLQNKLKSALFNYKGYYWEMNSTKAWTDFRTGGQPLTFKVFRNLFLESNIDPSFKDIYIDVFQHDACDFYNSKKSRFFVNYENDCSKLLNGTLSLGFNYNYMSLMDLLEKYLDDVEYYVYNSNATWRGVKTCNESKYESKIESLLRCIVYEDDFREQEIVYNTYIEVVLSELFEVVNNFSNTQFGYISTIADLLLYFYLIVIIGVIGGLWITLVFKWNKKFENEKMILIYSSAEFIERNQKLKEKLYEIKFRLAHE